ncbi:tellurite resistance protein terD [Yersinia phage vB_YenM_P778]
MSIILSKGTQTTIKSATGTPVMNLTVGAQWGMINKMGLPEVKNGFLSKLLNKASEVTGQLEAVDLDLSIIMYDANKRKVGECAFYSKNALNGAVLHSGDDRSGDASDDLLDNERIQFKGLEVAKTSVQTAVVVLNSFSHQKFDEIPFIRLAIYDGLYSLSEKAPRLMEFDLTNDKSFVGAEAVVLARLDKTNSGWAVTAIADAGRESSIAALDSLIQSKYL